MPVNLTVVGRTETGLVRKSNEDAFVIADLTGGSLLDQPQTTKFEVGEPRPQTRPLTPSVVVFFAIASN